MLCKYNLQIVNMQENNQQNVNFILNRLKLSLNIKSDNALGEYLGVKPATISAWRKRNSIDYALIFTKCKLLNLNWLIFGDEKIPFEKKTKGPYKKTTEVVKKEEKSDKEQLLIKMLDKKDKEISELNRMIGKFENQIEELKKDNPRAAFILRQETELKK